MRVKAAVISVLAASFLLPAYVRAEPNHEYPLTLSVLSATRFNRGGFVTTQIMGSLSDDSEHRQFHMTCDVGIFSIGPDGQFGNKYPARHGDKSSEIKIATREQGSDKVHEHTCKF